MKISVISIVSLLALLATIGFANATLTYVVLSAPINNSYVTVANQSFNFTAVGNETSNCTLFVDGVNSGNLTDVINNTPSHISYSINESTHTWFVNCTYDNLTNQSNTSLVTLDTTDPVVVITSPNVGSLLASPVSVSVSVTDANIENTNVSIINSSGTIVNSASSSSASFTVNITATADGVYNITATTSDKAGNTNFTTVTNITIDATDPTIVFGGGYNQSLNSTVPINITVNVTATDQHLNNITINLFSSGTLVQSLTNTSVNGSNSSSIYYIFTNLSNGNYSYNATAYDTVGNQKNTSTVKNIIIDSTLPTMTWNINTTTFIAPTSTYILQGSVNDSLSGFKNLTVYVNDSVAGIATWNSSTAIWNYTLSGLANTTYNLTIISYDNLGNNITLNGTLTVDNTTPTITFTSPNGAFTNSAVLLSFKSYDPAGLSSCNYSINGFDTSLSATYNFTKSLNCSNNVTYTSTLHLYNGNYTITINSTDALGNTNAVSSNFTIRDTTPPSITNVIPDGDSFNYTTTTVVINATTNENATCRWASTDEAYTSMNGNLFSNSGDGLSHTYNYPVSSSTSSSTSYTVYVSCTDQYRNNITGSAYSITFTIDKDTSSTSNNNGGGSGGSGSGGSGGGGGSTSGALVDTKSYLYPTLNSGTTNVQVDNMLITNVIVGSSQAVNNVRFTITKQATAPLPYTNNTVYTYMEIDHENLDDSLITSATIKFRVEDSWLTLNHLDRHNVFLLRMQNGWVSLNTTYLSDDSTYSYYQAASPGLSLYAIAATPTVAVVANNTNVTKNATTNVTAPKSNVTNASNVKSIVQAEIKEQKNWVLLAVTVLLVIMAFLMFYYSRYGRKQPGVSQKELEKEVEKDAATDLERSKDMSSLETKTPETPKTDATKTDTKADAKAAKPKKEDKKKRKK